jgi:CheY-like chemotaxis protein
MLVSPPTDSPSPDPNRHNGHQHRTLSVLIVDDEPAFCFAMAEILNLSGHQVEQANTVAQALEILERFTPDLILTDIMMPEADGLTFIRRLRSQSTWAGIPTIAVSAKAMIQDRDAAREAGADGYLSKPFSAQELKAAISEFTRPRTNAA